MARAAASSTRRVTRPGPWPLLQRRSANAGRQARPRAMSSGPWAGNRPAPERTAIEPARVAGRRRARKKKVKAPPAGRNHPAPRRGPSPAAGRAMGWPRPAPGRFPHAVRGSRRRQLRPAGRRFRAASAALVTGPAPGSRRRRRHPARRRKDQRTPGMKAAPAGRRPISTRGASPSRRTSRTDAAIAHRNGHSAPPKPVHPPRPLQADHHPLDPRQQRERQQPASPRTGSRPASRDRA